MGWHPNPPNPPMRPKVGAFKPPQTAQCERNPNPLDLDANTLHYWRRKRLRMFMGAEDAWKNATAGLRMTDAERVRRKAAFIDYFYQETVMLGVFLTTAQFQKHAMGKWKDPMMLLTSINLPDTIDRDGIRRI